MTSPKDKVLGMFFGIAIGDALGMPVETFSAEKIATTYGRVTDYKIPDGHKWFNGQPAGMITDDTQLTLAVAEGLIEADLDMDAQAKHHVAALKETDSGWGRTTRDSVRRIANGSHWSESGIGSEGLGNGVAMKVAPVGARWSLAKRKPEDFKKLTEVNPLNGEAAFFQFIESLNAMTHRTSLSNSATFAQILAVDYCFSCKQFDIEEFEDVVVHASSFGSYLFEETLTDDNITNRLSTLFYNHSDYNAEKLIADFGGGSCYVYNSLPFTYGFLLQNPNSIESLYDVVNAGGDTDSNGSMLGALLGALHGIDIFPRSLIEGLLQKDRVFDVANRFAEKFL